MAMSEESKKPQTSGPVPEYRPHFARWAATRATLSSVEKPLVAETATLTTPVENDAAIGAADTPPLSNGRRVWTTPVLSTTPSAGHPALPQAAAPPEGALEESTPMEPAPSELPSEGPIEEPVVAEFATSELPLEPVIEEPALEEAAASEEPPRPPEASTIAEYDASELPFEPVAEEPAEESVVAESTTSPLWSEPVVEESTLGEAAASELPAEPALEEPGTAVGQPTAAPPWSRDQLIVAAAAALVALFAILMTRPWEYFENRPPRANHAPQSLTKPEVLPSPIPPVAKPANQAAAAPAQSPIASAAKPPAPATGAAVAPMKPAAMPSIAPLSKPAASLPETAPKQPRATSSTPALAQTMPSIKVATVPPGKPALKTKPAAPAPESATNNDEEKEPPQSNRTDREFAQVRGKLMEASIRSQLAQMGYASLGLSVNDAGDVFLSGTFLSEADQDQVLAMIRGFHHVRDIYFSGSVWHSERASAPSPEAPVENAPSAAQAPLAKPAAAIPEQEPEDFPVTAADVPALRTHRSASPMENPTAAPAQAPR